MAPSNSDPTQQRAAWMNAAAKVTGAGLSFLLYIVLARTMEPAEFADVVVLLTWLAIATALSSLSMPLILVRYIVEYQAANRADLARGVMQFSTVLALGFSLLLTGTVTIVLFLGPFELPRNMPTSVLIASALLIPSVFILILSGFLQSQKRVVAAEVISNLLRSMLMISGITVLWFADDAQLSSSTVFIVYFSATTIATLICLAYSFSVWPREMTSNKPSYEYSIWIRSSLGFFAVMMAVAINERIDLLVMGFAAPPAEVATYAVASRFSQIVVFAITAVAAVMAPHLVEQLSDIHAGKTQPAQLLVRNTARTTFYISLLALIFFLLLAPTLINFFGPHYTDAYLPLIILTIGHVVTALFGAAILILTLTGRSKAAIISLACGITLNASLNIALVPVLGAKGAAIATATGSILAIFIAWAWIRRVFSIDTSVIGVILKPRK